MFDHVVVCDSNRSIALHIVVKRLKIISCKRMNFKAAQSSIMLFLLLSVPLKKNSMLCFINIHDNHASKVLDR